MKKIILVLLIVVFAAVPLLFASCSNVSQRDKLMPGYSCSEDGYELFSYNVFYKEAVIGTMQMKFEPLKNKSVTLPSPSEAETKQKTFSNVTGSLLSIDVAINNGDTVTSRVLYDGAFNPIHSYKRTFVDKTEKEMEVLYEGKDLYAKRFEGGKEVSSVEKSASDYLDNEMLYALIRASSPGDPSYTLGISTVNALTGETDSITVSKVTETTQHIESLTPLPGTYELAEGQTEYTIPCYELKISTGNQYASSYYLTIAKGNTTVKNEILEIQNVKKIITTITEGDYKYVLSDVEIV